MSDTNGPFREQGTAPAPEQVLPFTRGDEGSCPFCGYELGDAHVAALVITVTDDPNVMAVCHPADATITKASGTKVTLYGCGARWKMRPRVYVRKERKTGPATLLVAAVSGGVAMELAIRLVEWLLT